MVAALSFTACNGDDDDEGCDNRDGTTLKIDGESYYVEASIQKSYGSGLDLYLYI